MGQAAFCQPNALPVRIEEIATGGQAFVRQSCGCVTSASTLLVHDLHVDPVNKTEGEGVTNVVAEAAESEASTVPSDDEGAAQGADHLVLTRHRVFSPHVHANFHDHYRIERLLGEGSFGNVYEATTIPGPQISRSSAPGGEAMRPAPKRVAAKRFALPLPVDAKDDRGREAVNKRASFERERVMLARLEHPHIIKMYECFEDRDSLWIVLEFCRGGELYELIASRVRDGSVGGLEEDVSRTFFRQMLYAISYLHAMQVVHRDVKTENFLILGDRHSREGDIIKLCDFGTAVRLSREHPRAMERIGTLSYTAPEVYAKRGATVLADVWSLGAVLYVLLVGASPFRITGEEPREETVRRIQVGDYDKERPAWAGLSVEAKDLVQRFLRVDERRRTPAAEALRHPWVEPGSPPLLPDSSSAPPSPRLYLSPRCYKQDRLMDYAGSAPALLQLAVRFVHLDAMQQLALTICAQMMPEVELLHLQEPVPWYDLFFALDADEDGRLSFQEFARGMRLLLGHFSGMSDEHLVQLAKALDLDCSGTIDWVEWVAVALLSFQGLSDQQEPLQTAFRLLDRPSGDGIIGAADLLALLNSGSEGLDLPAARGRESALRMLSRWATVQPGQSTQKGRRGRHVSPDPQTSLALSDLQRVLETAIARGNEEELFNFRNRITTVLPPGGWLSCCQGSRNCQESKENTLVRQHRVWPKDSNAEPR